MTALLTVKSYVVVIPIHGAWRRCECPSRRAILPGLFGVRRPRGLENHSENEAAAQANLKVMPVLEVAERGKRLTILKANSRSIGKQEKSGETWTVQVLLQPISLKSDRRPARGSGSRHTGLRSRPGNIWQSRGHAPHVPPRSGPWTHYARADAHPSPQTNCPARSA